MKWMAPRARFELATLRLTAEQPIQSELAGVGANRGNSASCDETGPITFSFFIHLSFAFSRRSPPLVLRFHDGSRPHGADPLRESWHACVCVHMDVHYRRGASP